MYKRFLKILGIMTIFSMVLTAGQTGKITGKVLDKETGNPLPGVNVLLEGTSMGAATDANGEFYVMEVPPGLYNVQFSFIGYTSLNISNVRSTVDLTTNMGAVNMEPEVIEGEAVSVTAEKPLIEVNATNEVSISFFIFTFPYSFILVIKYNRYSSKVPSAIISLPPILSYSMRAMGTSVAKAPTCITS